MMAPMISTRSLAYVLAGLTRWGKQLLGHDSR